MVVENDSGIWGINVEMINEDYYRVEYLAFKGVAHRKGRKSIGHYQIYMNSEKLSRFYKVHKVNKYANNRTR